MAVPICLCVIVSHKETEERAEAAMNVPLLARAMHVGLVLLWMFHFESMVPVDTSTW